MDSEKTDSFLLYADSKSKCNFYGFQEAGMKIPASAAQA
jgi:hypothetical protein